MISNTRLAQAVKVLVDLKETVKPNWKKRAWYRDRRARHGMRALTKRMFAKTDKVRAHSA